MTSHALLFTDVVDSTKLVEQLGDARAAEIWAEHDRRARELLARYHGREIDRTDGFFLLFDDVDGAARCALGYHEALTALGLRARAGLHVGTVNLRENAPEDIARGAKPLEVEGLAKPFAARIMSLARGGQTLLSAAAQKALGEALPDGAEVESHGHYRLKGVERPVELFELGVRGAAPFAPPADAEKAYRLVRTGDLWRPLRELRHNLPAERDAFVGRTVELWSLAQRLDAGARLLTVIGSGGSGKTRFVRRYAWTWLGDWPGGVYFCDLSEARGVEGILFAVASALDVPLGKDDPVVQLGHAIAGRGHCLIILDNFEQVVAHAAATLGHWLDRAFDAAFVVTARERLHLPGEELFPIEPLSLEHDAIDLFVTRARAQRTDFALTEANRAVVAEVVRVLDGLPLAIELAAARIQVLSPIQLVERLKDRFRLLAGARGAAARQATLRAAIDWSWDLLTPWEQAALAQCSVFEGGFTLDAAEAVLDVSAWPMAPPVLDLVQALVEKSLLRTWVPAAQSRYAIDEPYFGMYVSIHEYAEEKLSAIGTNGKRSAEERHGRYFARFGTDEAIDALSRHGGAKGRRALALELDNVVGACRRAADRNDAQIAVATHRAASEVLDFKGPVALAILLAGQVLALEDVAPSLRATALLTSAVAARRAGRVADAQAWSEQALRLARDLNDRRREGRVLGNLGTLHAALSRTTEARRYYDDALAIHRDVGDRCAEGITLGCLGLLSGEDGRPDDARAYYEAALAIDREMGNRSAEGQTLGNMGLLCSEQGHMEEAQLHYQAALAIHREVGNRFEEGTVLGNLGNVCTEEGRLEDARAYYEVALAMSREIGYRRSECCVLHNFGYLLFVQGRSEEAEANYQRSLNIAREIGDRRREGWVLGLLGDLLRDRGHYEKAAENFEAALAIAREVGDQLGIGAGLEALGNIMTEQGRPRDARKMLGASEAVLRELGEPRQLAMLLCARGKADIAIGEVDDARAALAEAEAVALAIGAGANSGLGRAIEELREALA